MLSTILIVVLILLLIGALPTWPYSSGWGYYPGGGPRSHPHHRAHSGPNRTNLSASDAGKTGLRVLRGLHVPSLAIELLAKAGSPARSGAAALVKIKEMGPH